MAPGTFEATRAACQALADATTQHDQPRTGCITYAFTCNYNPQESAGTEPTQVHMLELFADTEAQETHLTENEGEAMVEMFQKSLQLVPNGATVVNVEEEDKAKQASLQFGGTMRDSEASDTEQRRAQRALGNQATRFVWPAAGLVVDSGALSNKHMVKYPELRPPGGAGVVLELRAEPADAEAGRQTLDALCRVIPQHAKPVSCFAAKAWWPDAGPHACGLLALVPQPDHVQAVFYRSTLEAALVASGGTLQLCVTAENWDAEVLHELLDHFAGSNIPVAERRQVFAGFLIHPAFCQPWHKRLADEKGRQGPAEAAAGSSQARAVENCTIVAPFSIRRHAVTAAAQAIVLSKDVHSSITATAKTAIDGAQVVVPLVEVLRKFCRLGRSDLEIPIGMVYAQLNQLRVLLRDGELLNTMSNEEIDADDVVAARMHHLLDQLSALGYALPPQGKVPLCFEGLEELVAAVEVEYAELVESGREALRTGGPVEYMALQELYPINSIVTTDALGGLGGTVIALRVDEAFYEPQRSIFGGRKYSFRLRLESVVALAGEYVSVRFEHIVEEWSGTKEQKRLDLQPLLHIQCPAAWRDTTTTAREQRDEHVFVELMQRAEQLRGLDRNWSYRAYRAGCFFPHKGGRNGSLGGAGSADRQAAPGRLVVDTRRGLDLGHAPAAAVDELGHAIAAVTKALRNIDRSLGQNDLPGKRLERIQSAGLTVWSVLPKPLELICWPTVVAFSLTTKQWGHVLVDGLVPLDPCREAWDQLVLPAKTKEMLLAMAESTRRYEETASAALVASTVGVGSSDDSGETVPRYRFRDVVDSKGAGVLFLLYGPPGTGKTLAVEALAALFARPLYSLSFAELGSSVSELEERLEDVLALAAHWDALVLLDEGDALVEKRMPGQLLLNSMTGVLLRLLEGFDGSLFITSNRASTFDPAALSRVTLAVRFEALDASAKTEVWGNMLARVIGDAEGVPLATAQAKVQHEFDLHALAQFAGSGRAVGTVMRLALGLCGQRRSRLTQSVLNDAIATWASFHEDLRAEGAAQTWD
jgi:quinol monooxygenase YgiN